MTHISNPRCAQKVLLGSSGDHLSRLYLGHVLFSGKFSCRYRLRRRYRWQCVVCSIDHSQDMVTSEYSLYLLNAFPYTKCPSAHVILPASSFSTSFICREEDMCSYPCLILFIRRHPSSPLGVWLNRTLEFKYAHRTRSRGSNDAQIDLDGLRMSR